MWSMISLFAHRFFFCRLMNILQVGVRFVTFSMRSTCYSSKCISSLISERSCTIDDIHLLHLHLFVLLSSSNHAPSYSSCSCRPFFCLARVGLLNICVVSWDICISSSFLIQTFPIRLYCTSFLYYQTASRSLIRSMLLPIPVYEHARQSKTKRKHDISIRILQQTKPHENKRKAWKLLMNR